MTQGGRKNYKSMKILFRNTHRNGKSHTENEKNGPIKKVMQEIGNKQTNPRTNRQTDVSYVDVE